MKLMQRSPQSCYSRSLSTSSRCLTPSKSGQKSIKGINLTIKKNDDKKLPGTMDRTSTPFSPSLSNSSLKFVTNSHLPTKQLFRKDSPFPKTYRDIRNKSLPAFNFDYHSFSEPSGFATLAQPYARIFDNTTSQKKNSNALSQKYSPFTDTSISRVTTNSYHPVNFKSTVGQCLKFDSQSPNKRQVKIYTDPSLKASPISQKKFTQTKISQIYLDTPPKLVSNQKQSSTLKSLKNRIMSTSIQGSGLKQNHQLKVDSGTKNGFEFSLNIDPLKNKDQSLQNVQKIVEKNQEKFNSKLKILQQQKKIKQKAAFFDLSPKVSQQFDASIYELTDSGKKGLHFSPNWRLAQSQSIDLSFIKPVKRKLTLGESEHINQDLKESLILTQLLNSLKKNTCNVKEQKKTCDFQLVRKCSQNLCLVRNKQTRYMSGLIKLEKNQRFIPSDTQFDGQKLCIQKYADFNNFILTQPFQYTLQEIFEMKLIEEKQIPALIRKFHPVLNQIKQKAKGRINLNKLKQRIVFTYGLIKLIPLIEVQ